MSSDYPEPDFEMMAIYNEELAAYHREVAESYRARLREEQAAARGQAYDQSRSIAQREATTRSTIPIRVSNPDRRNEAHRRASVGSVTAIQGRAATHNATPARSSTPARRNGSQRRATMSSLTAAQGHAATYAAIPARPGSGTPAPIARPARPDTPVPTSTLAHPPAQERPTVQGLNDIVKLLTDTLGKIEALGTRKDKMDTKMDKQTDMLEKMSQSDNHTKQNVVKRTPSDHENRQIHASTYNEQARRENGQRRHFIGIPLVPLRSIRKDGFVPYFPWTMSEINTMDNDTMKTVLWHLGCEASTDPAVMKNMLLSAIGLLPLSA
ncbi:uncharacterized protein K452DRAFT_296937 [Aplosporella prunicola CBS 121167]|uniref:Uncharacterized protein n=1 Tax=Aplosporella prunicola CBS 121167 TaxID=1176127 RepID=A0A6A6BGN8_9PEZI|nr:uncharacterized protein K452DRAFT_296937 [Aplosporella prunicola CBS 121167]KAF2143146.1 hypothetical protein K452DRAFT_296937 [Aplosporella prunicola CBS 121167]